MLGFKIIKKSEYTKLLRIRKDADVRILKVVEERKRLESDCDSLRQQLSEKMKEVNKLHDLNARLKSQNKSLSEFRRDTLEAMGNIDLAGFQLSYCTRKCEHCKHKQPECKKYKFGHHEYCVIPK